MLRVDGSTDEGRACGPQTCCAGPSRAVRQRTPARLSVWNVRREFKALRRGGDKLVMVAEGFWTWWSTRAVGSHVCF
jgi:hypothetical protein